MGPGSPRPKSNKFYINFFQTPFGNVSPPNGHCTGSCAGLPRLPKPDQTGHHNPPPNQSRPDLRVFKVPVPLIHIKDLVDLSMSFPGRICTFGARQGVPWGVIWCPWVALGWHLLGFLRFVWGENSMKRWFGGKSFPGPAFWSEAGAAGTQKYCFRARGNAKNTIRLELVLCVWAAIFTPPN